MSLSTEISKVVADIARHLKVPSRKEQDRLKGFLGSSEAVTIITQLFSSRLMQQDSSIETLKSVFYESLHIHVGIKNVEFANQLFDSLVAGCDAALQKGVEAGLLAAHEAKSAVRQKVLLHKIEGLKETLDLLRDKPPDISVILSYEKDLRRQIADRHGKIIPPNLERKRTFPIDALYVAPELHFRRVAGTEDTGSVTISELLDHLQRTVLLGNPGGGKSTLVSKICYDLSTGKSFQAKQVTPIPVILRDYGAEKKEKGISILQYFEGRCQSVYQLKAPPTNGIEYLLLSGRALIIFDGLDELLDTSYRREIADDIESFCNLFSNVNVLVTSREVGYDEAPLSRKIFDEVRLAEFNPSQVEGYVKNWFAADEELTASEKKSLPQSFLQESYTVSDLRSNPLMLGLMCSIYRVEQFIPSNRPEVYKKCAVMLFERWDKDRRIKTGFSFEESLSPLMAYLAFWIYSEDKLRTGVTETALVRKAAEYLHPRRYDTQEKAERAAGEFIAFCKGRAWIFTDTGQVVKDGNLYSFTHRTFLEYFSALYLFRIHPTPRDLLTVLLPKIERSEWDVVAQLAFHIQSRETEGAADELLTKLVAGGTEFSAVRSNRVLFAARCLEFVIASPDTIKKVVEGVVDVYFSAIAKKLPGPLPSRADVPIGERRQDKVVRYLLSPHSENVEIISNSMREEIRAKLDGSSRVEMAIAAELLLKSRIVGKVFARRNSQDAEKKSRVWDSFQPILIKEHAELINALAQEYLFVASTALDERIISLNTFVQWHGTRWIFMRAPSSSWNDEWIPIGQGPLYRTIMSHMSDTFVLEFADDQAALQAIREVLLKTSKPWTEDVFYAGLLDSWLLTWGARAGQHSSKVPEVSRETLGAVCILLAAGLERAASIFKPGVLITILDDLIFAEKYPVVKVLIQRFRGTQEGMRNQLRTALPEADARLLAEWIEQKVNFVATPPAKTKAAAS